MEGAAQDIGDEKDALLCPSNRQERLVILHLMELLGVSVALFLLKMAQLLPLDLCVFSP